MTKTEITSYFGSQREFAEIVSARWPHLSLTQGAVGQWAEHDVPLIRQLQAEELSGGALKASKDTPRGWSRPLHG